MWPLLLAVVERTGPGRSAEDRLADQDALARIGRGDTAALAELYDRHGRPLYSLALRILQDQGDAEDVVQEVFAQAWRQASRYDSSRGQVGAWLLTLARSRAIDRLRARRARPERVADQNAADSLIDQTAPADALLVSAEQVARVRAALDQLPLLQRMAIELAYYEGLTHTEIADRLEQPLGTVKTRIRTAMLKLRESLAGM
jgi:RNA polymerase sigma-70 factor (ECF subfamily)